MAGLYLKGSYFLNNQLASTKLCCDTSNVTMKLFPYQARKPVTRETIMTRIYTCHQDFKPDMTAPPLKCFFTTVLKRLGGES